MRSTLFLTLLLVVSLCTNAQHSFQKLDVNTLAGSGANRFTSFKGKTYFVANDSVYGSELWWTDGQSFGMVADMTPGMASTFNEQPFYHEMWDNNFAVVNDKLFFRARDAVYGTELFEYDGVNPPAMADPLGPDTFGRFHRLTEMNGLLYFIAKRQGGKAGLYSYDPVARTYKFCFQNDYLAELVRFNGKLAFTESQLFAPPGRLFIYDPATEQLDTIAENNSPNGGGIGNLYVYKGALYFAMVISPAGSALHRYDGSAIWRITNKAPGDAGAGYGRMVGMGNKLYYMATDGSTNLVDLYSYDIVTEKLTPEQPMASKAIHDLVVYGRRLFLAGDRYNNFEKGIFQYDGANLNLLSFPGQPYSEVPLWLAESNGKLFFAGQEGATPGDREAWVYVDSVALGVNDVARSSATVYPNPATTEAVISIKLQHATKLNVKLTDIQGRILYTTTEAQQYSAGKQEIKLPVSELAVGMYTYTVTDAEGTVMARGKLVKG